jgi:hypothetical protein
VAATAAAVPGAAGPGAGPGAGAAALPALAPPWRPARGGPLFARIHIPDRSGLPSALRGVGASITILPCASRGTPGVGNFGHCALTVINQSSTNTTVAGNLMGKTRKRRLESEK